MEGGSGSDAALPRATATPGRAGRSRAADVLLAVAAATTTIAVIALVGWARASRALPGLADLTREERHALAERMLAESPGLYLPARGDPDIAYTLAPGRDVRAWDSRIRADELGYRAPAAPKRAGSYRVVFVGDSWTFGLGVEEEDAFPRQVQRLAEADGSWRPRLFESFTLALPGYNTRNQMAALAAHLGLLDPDAVVVCPTVNDVDTTLRPLPGGTLGMDETSADPYGSQGPATFKNQVVDSHEFRRRFVAAMEDVARMERRLAARNVPMLLFFTALWDESVAHSLVQVGRIDAPYLILPPRLTLPRWLDATHHPTAAAHARYAPIVLRALHALRDPAAVPAPGIFVRDPTRSGWRPEARARMKELTEDRIPAAFVAGQDAGRQCVHIVNHASGLVGRTAHVLVRRPPGARRMHVTLRRLPDPWLYPLTVALSIPSAAGGTRVEVVLGVDGPERSEHDVALPDDVGEGEALDLLLLAERVSVDPRWPLGGALFLERAEPR